MGGIRRIRISTISDHHDAAVSESVEQDYLEDKLTDRETVRAHNSYVSSVRYEFVSAM